MVQQRPRRKKTINSSSSGVSSDDLSDDYSEEDSSDRPSVTPDPEKTAPTSVVNQTVNDELNRLGKEVSQLTVLKAQLESEMTQSCDKLVSAQGQLREWESKCSLLEERIKSLSEERCELEEQENDSRLQSQR